MWIRSFEGKMYVYGTRIRSLIPVVEGAAREEIFLLLWLGGRAGGSVGVGILSGLAIHTILKYEHAKN